MAARKSGKSLEQPNPERDALAAALEESEKLSKDPIAAAVLAVETKYENIIKDILLQFGELQAQLKGLQTENVRLQTENVRLQTENDHLQQPAPTPPRQLPSQLGSSLPPFFGPSFRLPPPLPFGSESLPKVTFVHPGDLELNSNPNPDP